MAVKKLQKRTGRPRGIDENEALERAMHVFWRKGSYDHDQEEQYAPIDVVDYVHGSTFVSHESDLPNLTNAELQNASVILDPAPQSSDPTVKDAGTINSNQPVCSSAETRCLPRNIYVSPSEAAKHGSDWNAALMTRHTGMYGHVILITEAAQIKDATLAGELNSLYNCTVGSQSCSAQVIKIEFWQFFGYSHDFQNPAAPFTNLLGPDTTEILADIFDHGGDWCSVQMYVDAGWAFSSRPDQSFLVTYHYPHGQQIGFDFSRMTSRPTAAKEFQGYSIEEFQGPFYGQPVEFPINSSGTEAAVLVAQFSGYWGYYGDRNRNKPPQGPTLHAEWTWDSDTPDGIPNILPPPSNIPF
jgi:hypothetical protein